MQEHIEAVQRMQDYIREHLYEEISILQLAEVSLFSPWHARRLFLEYTGLTTAEYIRKLRLRETALRLRDGEDRVVDVALECGFKSTDGFQRAFNKEYGHNPKAYATSPVPLKLFTPYGVKFKFVKSGDRRLSSTRKVFLQVISKPKRKVIVKRGIAAKDYWTYCEEIGCDVWGILTSIRSISGEPVCLWLPEQYIIPGTSEYVQGVEVDSQYDGMVPDGFDVLEFPAAKYLMFQGEPFSEEDYELAIKEIEDAIEKYDPSLIGFQWDNTNPIIQLEPIGSRGYIELVAICQAGRDVL